MDKNSIVINRTGVYLFHSPTKVSLQINREILLVLSAPSQRIAGLLYIDANIHPSDSVELLRHLIQKMESEFHVTRDQIQVKLIGMSSGTLPAKARLQKLLSEYSLSIVAEDTGRSVSRTIFVDCESGLVGVSYADSLLTAPVPAERSVTSKGSKRSYRALALTRRTHATKACKKVETALEEWTIDSASTIGPLLKGKPPIQSYSAIILFDDIGKKEEKQVTSLIERLQKNHRGIRIFWSGKRPKFASGVLPLPAVTPTKTRSFRNALQTELDVLAGHGTSEVIPFPATARKTATRR